MIVGKDNVIAWFDSLPVEVKSWSLYHRNKTETGNPINKIVQGKDDGTKSFAREHLIKNLDIQANGQFTLVCASDTSAAKGKYITDFELTAVNTGGNLYTAPQAANMGGIPDGYVSKNEISGMIEEGVKKAMQERELQELKAKVIFLEKREKELEKETSEPMNVFLGAIGPYIPQLMGAVIPKVAGIPEPGTIPQHEFTNQLEMETMQNEIQGIDLTDDQHQRLEKVVGIFSNASPEWLEVLEKMAAKVQKNPNVISTFKMFL